MKEKEPVDFSSFLLGLATSVMMHPGLVENPATGKKEKALHPAKRTIDLLEILKEKTKNNPAGGETSGFRAF